MLGLRKGCDVVRGCAAGCWIIVCRCAVWNMWCWMSVAKEGTVCSEAVVVGIGEGKSLR